MDATVRRYKLDTAASGSSIDFAGLVARAQGMPVRCAVMDPTGKRIAYASESVLHLVLAVVWEFEVQRSPRSGSASTASTILPLSLPQRPPTAGLSCLGRFDASTSYSHRPLEAAAWTGLVAGRGLPSIDGLRWHAPCLGRVRVHSRPDRGRRGQQLADPQAHQDSRRNLLIV